MKAKKLFLCALLVGLSCPFASSANHPNKVTPEYQKEKKVPQTRSPLEYDVDFDVESVNNTLFIMFTGYLPDADITVTDANGNIVIQQTLVTITSGTTLYVYPDDSYPYDIVITSPTLDIVGQIINE